MIGEVDIFNPPKSGAAKIWRYMGFAKYVSLLDIGALYFVRVDRVSGTSSRDRMETRTASSGKSSIASSANWPVKKKPTLSSSVEDVFRWLRVWTFSDRTLTSRKRSPLMSPI